MKLLSIFKKTIDVRIWFVFGILAHFFFLVIGAPTPPGLLYNWSADFLKSQPGHADLNAGSLTNLQVLTNVDVYNAYLVKAISVFVVNIVGYYFLFILSIVLIWNYILTRKISVRSFWRIFFFNILWLLIAVAIGAICYLIMTLVGYIGSDWWQIFVQAIFVLAVLKLVLFTIYFNGLYIKHRNLPQTLYSFANAIKQHWVSNILVLVGSFVILFLVSLIFLIPNVSFDLTMTLLILTQLFVLAWLHLYVAAAISDEKIVVTHSKK